MSLAGGQPRVRFVGRYNPGDIAGLAYVPKTIAVTVDITTTTTTTTETIMSVEAGTLVKRVDAICSETTHSTDLTFTVGTDGNPDAFISASDFSLDTLGNWATNVSSTNADAPEGLYFPAADNLAYEIDGTTVTDGQVQILIEYYELGSVFVDGGIHLEL